MLKTLDKSKRSRSGYLHSQAIWEGNILTPRGYNKFTQKWLLHSKLLKVYNYFDLIDGGQKILFAEIRHTVKIEMAQGGANGRRQSARVVHVVDEEKFGPAHFTWWTVIKNKQNLKKNSSLNPKWRIIWLTWSAKTIRWWTDGTKRYIWPLPLFR